MLEPPGQDSFSCIARLRATKAGGQQWAQPFDPVRSNEFHRKKKNGGLPTSFFGACSPDSHKRSWHLCGGWAAPESVENQTSSCSLPNGLPASTEVNNNFVGKLVMMHRQANGAPSVPSAYDDYFAKKTRRWELRLQGRFVRKPTGKLFGGVRSSICGMHVFSTAWSFKQEACSRHADASRLF